jgi:hypothetical protein
MMTGQGLPSIGGPVLDAAALRSAYYATPLSSAGKLPALRKDINRDNIPGIYSLATAILTALVQLKKPLLALTLSETQS